jgi:cytochrome c-type biogenesis protein
MSEFDLFQLVILPIGLGLLGFVEPCSIGSSLVLIKVIEGQSTVARITQVSVFALTRAILIGVLGALAALIGSTFLGLQKGAWILLGVLYVAIAVFYAVGKAGFLMRSFGPSLSRPVGLRSSIGLGLPFGLNIPACAAPSIFALLGTAALGGGAGGTFAPGFVSLGLFWSRALTAVAARGALGTGTAAPRSPCWAVCPHSSCGRHRADRPRRLVDLLRLVRTSGGLGMNKRPLARGLPSLCARPSRLRAQGHLDPPRAHRSPTLGCHRLTTVRAR